MPLLYLIALSEALTARLTATAHISNTHARSPSILRVRRGALPLQISARQDVFPLICDPLNGQDSVLVRFIQYIDDQ